MALSIVPHTFTEAPVRPASNWTAASADTALKPVWPWRSAPDGCCCVVTDYDPNDAGTGTPDHAGCRLPPRLRGAAKRRQAEYVAGRLCAGDALKRVSGVRSFPAMRPDGAPEWPAHYTGSISHSQGSAVAVAAPRQRCRRLGVDLEKLLAPDEAREIVPLVLNERERKRLESLPAVAATTLGFSVKESLFKALSPSSLSFSPFEIAEIVDWNPAGTVVLQLDRHLSADWTVGRVFHVQWAILNNFVLTLACVKNRPCETHAWNVGNSAFSTGKRIA